jgi:hypothetical protein
MAYDSNQPFLLELDKAEDELTAADERLSQAQALYEIAEVKYAAIRDALSERLQASPYSRYTWDDNKTDRGQYRFIRMGVGDAVYEVLSEATEPLSLNEINDRLSAGAGRFGLRSINGALQQKGGIRRVEPEPAAGYEDVRYEIAPEEVEPDDLPF